MRTVAEHPGKQDERLLGIFCDFYGAGSSSSGTLAQAVELLLPGGTLLGSRTQFPIVKYAPRIFTRLQPQGPAPQHPRRMHAIQRPDPDHGASRALSLLLVALLHALLLFAILHFMVVTPKPASVAAPEQSAGDDHRHRQEACAGENHRTKVEACAVASTGRAASHRARCRPTHRRLRRPISPAWVRRCSAARLKTSPA